MKDPQKLSKILELVVDRDDFKDLQAIVDKQAKDLEDIVNRTSGLEKNLPIQMQVNLGEVVLESTFTDQLHFQVPNLVKLLALNQAVLISGPAGCGKTQAAEHAATAIKKPFYAISVSLQTSKSDLFGFISATGKYIPSLFRKAYEEGGVFLVDEIDAGNANVLLLLNSSLSNGYTAFPDKMVKRHEDFRIIASANTIGIGGDNLYVGRNQLDAATLDRFVIMKFIYDEKIEDKIVEDKMWLGFCRDLRKKIFSLGVPHFISTRTMISGNTLIKSGIDMEIVKTLLIWNKLSDTDGQRLRY